MINLRINGGVDKTQFFSEILHSPSPVTSLFEILVEPAVRVAQGVVHAVGSKE